MPTEYKGRILHCIDLFQPSDQARLLLEVSGGLLNRYTG
jgi:hypothetical protein